MMPKALYGAVWVIKNVYCDGAERLTERVLLFTSYRCGLIHSAERLRSRVEQRWTVGSMLWGVGGVFDRPQFWFVACCA